MEEPRQLVRAVQNRRRFDQARPVLVAMGTAAACAAIATAARPAPVPAGEAQRIAPHGPPVVVPVSVPVPVIVPVSVSVPVPVRDRPRAADDLGPCPRAFREASDIEVVALPEKVDAVVASSRDVRLLAAWNRDHVFLSTNEGRSFRRVLDRDEPVRDAGFDCYGQLLVVRGNGWLGVDDGAAATARWTEVGRFADPDEAYADWAVPPSPAEWPQLHLIVDRTTAAVIGTDPADLTRLVIARADRRGRWRLAPLFQDTSSSWDGLRIESVGSVAGGRVHALVVPWEGDMCGGDGHYHEVVIDIPRGTARSRDLGWERPHQLADDESVDADPFVIDAAGRRIVVRAEPAPDEPQLRRAEIRPRGDQGAETPRHAEGHEGDDGGGGA